MPEKLRVVLLGGYEGDGWLSISRYQRELSAHLSAITPSGELEITSVAPRPGAWVTRLSKAEGLGKRFASYWSRFLCYPRQLPKREGVLYHIMDQSLSYLVRYLPPHRTIVTCHDLLHFPLREKIRSQSWFPWTQDWLYRYCVGGLRSGPAILAVSDRNRQDAIRYLGCDPNRIRVVYEGVSPAFLQPPDKEKMERLRSQWRIPAGVVLLHVGICTLYKNIEGLLQALPEIRRRLDRPVTLVRVGPPFNAKQRSLARGLGILENIREAGVHGDDTLPSFNHLADCFIFPSLYEGFGFPPLEAMACGVPVVASNRGSLPEILGDAALLVDPENPRQIAEGVLSVLSNEGLRKDLIVRGRERSSRYRWEQTARETLQLYRELAEG